MDLPVKLIVSGISQKHKKLVYIFYFASYAQGGVANNNDRSIIIVPAGIYLLKVNNRNTRTRCEICPKLTIKTLERHQWRIYC